MNAPVPADVERAAGRLAGIAHRTPVLTSRTADAMTGARLFFKCENLQRGGAFKFRGAYNAIAALDDARRRAGVVAFSSGNHAQAIAYAASLLGVPAITLPTGLGRRGLPLGLQLVSRPLETNYLLAVAGWCERQLPFDNLLTRATAGS